MNTEVEQYHVLATVIRNKYGSERGTVAVMPLTKSKTVPKIINYERAVWYEGDLHVGKTEKCEYQRALKQAEQYCQELNAEAQAEVEKEVGKKWSVGLTDILQD